MQKLLNRINWIKPVGNQFDYINFSKRKRLIVFSQLCIISAIAAIIQGAYDLFDGFPLVMAMDLLIAFILFLGFYINYSGKPIAAKLLVFIFINIALFLFASIVPKGIGIYILFFPLIIFYFISYDYENRIYAIAFTIFSVIINVILLVTDFQPLGPINMQPSDPSTPFLINFLLSIILISLGINFMIKLNHIGEELLLKKQEETESLSKELQDKNQTLKKANEELDRFVYSTSHDLKSPLASVLGLLNLAKFEKEKTPETVAKYLEMMEERVNHLDGFIKDILDYSRNSRQDIVISEVNVSDIVSEVFLANRFLVNSDKIKIVSRIDLNETLLIDKNRLIRVLNNLVSNAIKYCDLRKENPEVCVSAMVKNKNLVVAVKDNGVGIDDEYKERIFDMFFRGTELANGSGLGLYIAREMVLKMKGTMEFESQLNEGSIFRIIIPIVKSAS